MGKNQAVDQALNQMGFRSQKGRWYGLWQDYPCTVRQNAPYCYVDVATRSDKNDKSAAKAMKSKLKERCPKKVHGCVNHGDHISFVMTIDKTNSAEEQLRALFDEIINAMKEQSLTPADTCVVCGKDHPDSLCLLESYQPVHSACVRSISETTRADVESNEQQGSYLTGMIGGILGMLVGLIPSLLSILLADRIYAVLFALVPLCAMWGYRKLRGKRSAASIAIIIVLSVIGVVLLEVLVVAISIKQEFGIGLASALHATMNYLFTAEGIGVLLQESLVEFLFMAIGIFLAWRFLNQTNTGRIAAMDAVDSTLSPISGEWEDPDWSEK